ncbi:MAG: kinetochore-associated Ndc80 complex subunit spc25 [Chrysothrix sp. TS-e1954]|nr:MAG: kinetochore-associated Ndc80 complex subunit spc25 [Chrysothrix sp. TS-e1954]
MALTLEPTLNLGNSIARAPYSSSAAPSMASTLPPLNFGFDDLRARMSSFTSRFDDFIERGRRRVLEERNHFRMSIAEISEDQVAKERDIDVLANKAENHASNVALQVVETDEMSEAIASLTFTRDTHAVNVASLRSRLASTQSSVNSKKATQRQQSQYLSHQESFNAPELATWEECLGLRIEATGVPDQVRFVFTNCDRSKPLREAWFELDMTGKGYGIIKSRPRIEGKEAVERSLQSMGENEDLGAFLKDIRQTLVSEMN